MDPKFKEFYEKNVIPIGNRIIIKYCKIDCLGNKLTYDSVQAALEFTRAGRAGYSTITYDPFAYTIECENIYEFYLDHICNQFEGKIVVEFKKE